MASAMSSRVLQRLPACVLQQAQWQSSAASVCVSIMVRELAELMCNLSGNGGILSGLWCLDKGVQALVLFE